ncbi:Hsp20/alpha crystallin family protein [Leptospira borgpetersenii]|uniref:Hsp20/alpha crystallin family protein n=1 Tax=Leptospira borgpetersenii serovar Ballum TaxID=280505 RepID=A0A0E3BQ17_LEPBO|nr:Hsp20/alpha crystallin family protein [Leptospira borgpetersenii]EMO11069.1 Hsp20/alpha crystallin family protein [Leptospira borgpetersenii str. Noumea 25]ALO27130.1 Hsp20/alpha crystallin family protein [Leptospira borgpetersenii serovar Ballum]ANH01558.1 Spore protein SP21 family protein [Leptospira borgpetersenii str. 4E]EKQ98986.1 Hsp20/alpha crystallin family protein [Leptospira borgpetersenii serovar Castellonis str. 200801910]KGE24514.1 molecular chaperone Hsp20 [Leptospira borgpete
MNEFRILEDLQNQFSSLWNPFLLHGGSAYPALNIHKGIDAVTITALIPGIEPENLEITMSGNHLHLNGEIPKSTQGVNRAERFHGKFHRTLELPTEVDSEKANAEFKNGVLVLTLPVRESVKPRKIKIQTK